MKVTGLNNNTIAINELRRKFGEIEKALPYVDHFTITKKGVPFAVLSATPTVKRELMKKMAGAFKNTKLEKDDIWKDILKRKSRKKDIKI